MSRDTIVHNQLFSHPIFLQIYFFSELIISLYLHKNETDFSSIIIPHNKISGTVLIQTELIKNKKFFNLPGHCSAKCRTYIIVSYMTFLKSNYNLIGRTLILIACKRENKYGVHKQKNIIK